jgi:hypothetical protein
MTELLVRPSLDRVRVVKHGIVTFPGDMATLQAPRGIRINDIPLGQRGLQIELQRVGKLFVQRQEVRGLIFIDHEDMHVYGPFPSYEFHDAMIDHDTLNIPPEQMASFVRDRATDCSAFADYVLVAAFMAVPKRFEVWTPEHRLRDLKGVPHT